MEEEINIIPPVLNLFVIDEIFLNIIGNLDNSCILSILIVFSKIKNIPFSIIEKLFDYLLQYLSFNPMVGFVNSKIKRGIPDDNCFLDYLPNDILNIIANDFSYNNLINFSVACKNNKKWIIETLLQKYDTVLSERILYKERKKCIKCHDYEDNQKFGYYGKYLIKLECGHFSHRTCADNECMRRQCKKSMCDWCDISCEKFSWKNLSFCSSYCKIFHIVFEFVNSSRLISNYFRTSLSKHKIYEYFELDTSSNCWEKITFRDIHVNVATYFRNNYLPKIVDMYEKTISEMSEMYDAKKIRILREELYKLQEGTVITSVLKNIFIDSAIQKVELSNIIDKRESDMILPTEEGIIFLKKNRVQNIIPSMFVTREELLFTNHGEITNGVPEIDNYVLKNIPHYKKHIDKLVKCLYNCRVNPKSDQKNIEIRTIESFPDFFELLNFAFHYLGEIFGKSENVLFSFNVRISLDRTAIYKYRIKKSNGTEMFGVNIITPDKTCLWDFSNFHRDESFSKFISWHYSNYFEIFSKIVSKRVKSFIKKSRTIIEGDNNICNFEEFRKKYKKKMYHGIPKNMLMFVLTDKLGYDVVNHGNFAIIMGLMINE